MLSDFTWNMTGYILKHPVNPSERHHPLCGRAHLPTGTGASSGGQSERIYPVCLAGKEFDIFLILPTPLRAAA